VVYVGVAGKIAGLIAVADTVKPDARAAIDALRRLGKAVVLLTGDNRRTGEAIGRLLGIDRVLAEVRPGGKATRSGHCRRPASASRWSATASTTPRR